MKNCEYCDYFKAIESGNAMENGNAAEKVKALEKGSVAGNGNALEIGDTLRNGNAMDTGKRSVCLFTDTMLFEGKDDTDLEYPCRNMDYQEYLNRKNTHVYNPMLTKEDWKIAYETRHIASGKESVTASARAIV